MDPSSFPMALNHDAQAQQIFRIIHEFFSVADAHRRNPALESFPQSFPPWRRVYKLPAEPQIGDSTAAYYQTMEPWQPSELSFGGAGPLWCFTVLPRTGENVSRKTDDGQAWLSKSGRGPKKGYPEQIWVDKLVITGKAFHMLELTLKQENKPNVALCKIWRRGNSEAASPQTISLGASTSSFQEVLNSPINEGLTAMQIDQPQGQLEGIEQQQTNDSALLMSGYVLVHSTQGLPDFTEGSIQSTWPDDDSIYQGAVSYLYNEKESFKHVASCSKNDAHELASAAQSLASTLRNLLNFLGIKKEAENTRPTDASNDNNQIMEMADHESNPVEPTPEANPPDQDPVQLTEGHSIDIDDTDQEQVQLTEVWYSISNDDIDCNYFNSDALINHLRDGGNGTNFDDDDDDNDDLGV